MPTNARGRQASRENPHPTALKILDAAERLFANQGISETSLRDIESQAGVNNAAIYYHFGSKDDLLAAVFGRLAGPLAEERLRMLDVCAPGAGRPPMIEQLLTAYLAPICKMGGGSPDARLHFTQIRSRLTPETGASTQQLVERYFGETTRRFSAAFRAANPELSLEEVEWRFHIVMGALGTTLSSPARVQSMGRGSGGGHYDPSNFEKALPRLVYLLSGMFRMPSYRLESQTPAEEA